MSNATFLARAARMQAEMVARRAAEGATMLAEIEREIPAAIAGDVRAAAYVSECWAHFVQAGHAQPMAADGAIPTRAAFKAAIESAFGAAA
jgi:hypothetical protein